MSNVVMLVWYVGLGIGLALLVPRRVRGTFTRTRLRLGLFQLSLVVGWLPYALYAALAVITAERA